VTPRQRTTCAVVGVNLTVSIACTRRCEIFRRRWCAHQKNSFGLEAVQGRNDIGAWLARRAVRALDSFSADIV
jgi:hypothetical protein